MPSSLFDFWRDGSVVWVSWVWWLSSTSIRPESEKLMSKPEKLQDESSSSADNFFIFAPYVLVLYFVFV